MTPICHCPGCGAHLTMKPEAVEEIRFVDYDERGERVVSDPRAMLLVVCSECGTEGFMDPGVY